MDKFPSPCGDELFLELEMCSRWIWAFPSPCGDELFRPMAGRRGRAARFRPLAGMNCFNKKLEVKSRDAAFPSPCGDELFRYVIDCRENQFQFPSPCGDELFPRPSGRGDG